VARIADFITESTTSRLQLPSYAARAYQQGPESTMIHVSAPSSNEQPVPPSSDAPSPTLRVSVALFRWAGDQLETAISLQRRLPSDAPAANESLDAAAQRIIRDYGNVDAQYLEQLYTFSRHQGDHREVIISYLGLFSPETTTNISGSRIVWSPAGSSQLADDVEHIVLEYALVRLRAKLGYTNIAFHLVPATFTLSELQLTYESILGHPVDKRNFRRRMIASGILTSTNEKRRVGSHRPAALYRFTSHDDHSAYLTPPWAPEHGQEPNEGV
jgi:8-oxo-dGTP diphosphatase